MTNTCQLFLSLYFALALAHPCFALTPNEVAELSKQCRNGPPKIERILGMNATTPSFPISGEDLHWVNIKGRKMALWSTSVKQRLLIQGSSGTTFVADGNQKLINEYLRQLERNYRPKGNFRAPYQAIPFWTTAESIKTKEGPVLKIKILGTAPAGVGDVLETWKSEGENPIFCTYKGKGIYEVPLPSTLNQRLSLTEKSPILFVAHQGDELERSEYQKYLAAGRIPISMRDHFMHDAVGHAEIFYRFAMSRPETWETSKSMMRALIAKGNESQAQALLNEFSNTFENAANRIASDLRRKGYLELGPLSYGLEEVIQKTKKYLAQ